MTLLTSDPQYIWDVTEFAPFVHSLPPKLAVDGYRSAMPIMAVPENGQPVLFLKEIDRTNVEYLRHDKARFVWHSPYFTFGGLRGPTDAYNDLIAAVRGEVEGPLRLDSRMPMELFRQLIEGLDAAPQHRFPFEAPSKHYVVSCKEADSAFMPGREELKAAAEPFLAQLTADLRPWATRPPDDRYQALDRLMSESDLDALVVASPLAIQDMTGIPMRLIGEGSWAIYPQGSPVVHLLSTVEVPWIDLPLAQSAGSKSVGEILGSARVGFEDVALSYDAWLNFGLEESRAQPATGLVRRWRELRSWEDLAAYIIGSRVTLEAIEAALAFVAQEWDAGRPVTELNAYERYRSRVGSFIRQHQLPIRVRTYFTHTHAGDRSHFPASATNHEVTPKSSLKIDGGLEIYDSRGMFLGVSDVTRSAVGTAESRGFYELLDRALIEGAISACRPGATGSEVYSAGTAHLDSARDQILAGGFMPGDMPVGDAFARNIGHLIGKQEPATVEFKSSDRGTLATGMVAAAEFQWPFANFCIGVEDLLLVTEDGPLNLTRPT